jgi:hypothetical protein
MRVEGAATSAHAFNRLRDIAEGGRKCAFGVRVFAHFSGISH